MLYFLEEQRKKHTFIASITRLIHKKRIYTQFINKPDKTSTERQQSKTKHTTHTFYNKNVEIGKRISSWKNIVRVKLPMEE